MRSYIWHSLLLSLICNGNSITVQRTWYKPDTTKHRIPKKILYFSASCWKFFVNLQIFVIGSECLCIIEHTMTYQKMIVLLIPVFKLQIFYDSHWFQLAVANWNHELFIMLTSPKFFLNTRLWIFFGKNREKPDIFDQVVNKCMKITFKKNLCFQTGFRNCT